jgi:hypothetical protein
MGKIIFQRIKNGQKACGKWSKNDVKGMRDKEVDSAVSNAEDHICGKFVAI